jgi:hypothetical protein
MIIHYGRSASTSTHDDYTLTSLPTNLMVSIITTVTKCPVTQTITVGTKEICKTSEVESTQFITRTHLDICPVCSRKEPTPPAYPIHCQFPGAPSPKTSPTPAIAPVGFASNLSEPILFKGVAAVSDPTLRLVLRCLEWLWCCLFRG